jgi:hypothetical protein
MQLLARERNAVRQLIDRSTLHWRSLARVLQNEQLWNGCLWRKADVCSFDIDDAMPAIPFPAMSKL